MPYQARAGDDGVSGGEEDASTCRWSSQLSAEHPSSRSNFQSTMWDLWTSLPLSFLLPLTKFPSFPQARSGTPASSLGKPCRSLRLPLGGADPSTAPFSKYTCTVKHLLEDRELPGHSCALFPPAVPVSRSWYKSVPFHRLL